MPDVSSFRQLAGFEEGRNPEFLIRIPTVTSFCQRNHFNLKISVKVQTSVALTSKDCWKTTGDSIRKAVHCACTTFDMLRILISASVKSKIRDYIICQTVATGKWCSWNSAAGLADAGSFRITSC